MRKPDPKATAAAAKLLSSKLLEAQRDNLALRRRNRWLEGQVELLTAALQTLQLTPQPASDTADVVLFSGDVVGQVTL